jgi:hypothetical protein
MKEVRYAFLALLLALLAACESKAPWPSSGVFVGYYTHGFEQSDFKPVGTGERWWLSGNIGVVTNLFVAPSSKELPKVQRPVYIVVRGTLSAEGRHGHLGGYKRELSVQEVIEIRVLRPDETVLF